MKKKKQPTLASVTAEYKKRGFKRPRSLAKHYMAGFKAAKKYKVKFLINDDPYLALKVRADGCHLGQKIWIF